MTHLRTSVLALVAFTMITGFLYPLAMTGFAQLAAPGRANGSLIGRKGSSLIGQNFDQPKYFWGRLSATSPSAYSAYDGQAATGSSGSNYGPLNPALVKAVEDRVRALRDADPGNKRPLPVDLATASGSGLDPHISPEAADYQVSRVARVRGMSESAVREIVRRHVQGRDLGLLGQPRVNVLELNLELDSIR